MRQTFANASHHEFHKLIVDANHVLKLSGGIVFAVPIPHDHAAEGRHIQDAIDTALSEAKYALSTCVQCSQIA